MKVNLVSSQRVKVRVTEYEDADILAAIQAGKVAELTIAVNADRRQKVALVEFRADLSELIEKEDFPVKTKTVTKDGKSVEEPDETEGEHIARFRDALAGGNVIPTGFTLPTGATVTDKEKDTAANNYIQTLADKLGPYVLSIDRPEPKARAGKVAQWAIDKATAAFAKGSDNVAKWVTQFNTGFTSPEGIVIDPIPLTLESTPTDATAEQTAAVTKANITAFAAAIAAYAKQKAAKSSNEFAA
jgi:hypothetical protein